MTTQVMDLTAVHHGHAGTRDVVQETLGSDDFVYQLSQRGPGIRPCRQPGDEQAETGYRPAHGPVDRHVYYSVANVRMTSARPLVTRARLA